MRNTTLQITVSAITFLYGLESIDKMTQSAFDEIVEKYVEMNIAHLFREGKVTNGYQQKAA